MDNTDYPSEPIPASGKFGCPRNLMVSNGNSSTFISATSTGVAVSKDGGSTWQVQTVGHNPQFSYVTQVVQDPINPNRILCLGISTSLSPNSDIYFSLDAGLTWTQQGTAYVYDQFPQRQTGPGIYIFSEGSLYSTFDGGVSYQNIGPANDQSAFTAVFSPLSPNTIAYQGLNDLSMSQDGGKTWVVSETGLNARAIGQVKYAGTSGPLYAATLTSRYSRNGVSSSQL